MWWLPVSVLRCSSNSVCGSPSVGPGISRWHFQINSVCRKYNIIFQYMLKYYNLLTWSLPVQDDGFRCQSCNSDLTCSPCLCWKCLNIYLSFLFITQKLSTAPCCLVLTMLLRYALTSSCPHHPAAQYWHVEICSRCVLFFVPIHLQPLSERQPTCAIQTITFI